MNLRPFSLNFSLLVAACSLAASASAQVNQTVTGNLFVDQALDVNGNTASFGTNGLSPGYSQVYTNGTLATVDFSASASTVNWTWYQGNTNPQLKLDSTNKLNLYSTTNPTTPQIVLNPVGTSTFAQGLTVTGVFTTSSGLTASGGTVTGGTNGLTINSGGTNKNITLSPNGTGVTTTTKPLRVTSTTSSTSSTTGALTVSGGVGVGGALNVGSAISTSRLTVAGLDTTAANSVANFTDSAAKSLLFVRNDGNVGIGTSSPQGRLDIFNSTNAAMAPLLSLRSDFAAAGRYGMIRFGDQTQTTDYQKGAIIYESVATSARGKLHLALENTDGSGSVALSDAKLTVLSNGNVGIGTTTPTSRLDVAGDAKITGTLAVTKRIAKLRVDPQGDLSMGGFMAGSDVP